MRSESDIGQPSSYIEVAHTQPTNRADDQVSPQESYARQVLPCLDEPAYRAQFNLAVEVLYNFMPCLSTR